MFMNCSAVLMVLVSRKLGTIYWNMFTITLSSLSVEAQFVCHAMHGMGMNTWIDMVEDNRICCDELALLGLSVMYQRHCLVVTKNKFWSTIETKELLSIINLMKECTVRLLYLGNMKFGTLHWHFRNPQPVQPKPNLGQFKIIEEYTLDEPTTSGESSTADNSETEHMETATSQEFSPPDAELVKQTTNFLLFLSKP